MDKAGDFAKPYRNRGKMEKVCQLLLFGCVFGHDIWKTALIIWGKRKVLSYWLTSFQRNKLMHFYPHILLIKTDKFKLTATVSYYPHTSTGEQ